MQEKLFAVTLICRATHRPIENSLQIHSKYHFHAVLYGTNFLGKWKGLK